MKIPIILIILVSALPGCATFRDACTMEIELIQKYEGDTNACVLDLQREARENRGWVERGDRVYFK